MFGSLSACRPVFLLRSHTPASAFSTVALTPQSPAPTPSRLLLPTITVPRPARRGQWWCSLLAAQGSRRAATGRAVRGGARVIKEESPTGSHTLHASYTSRPSFTLLLLLRLFSPFHHAATICSSSSPSSTGAKSVPVTVPAPRTAPTLTLAPGSSPQVWTWLERCEELRDAPAFSSFFGIHEICRPAR